MQYIGAIALFIFIFTAVIFFFKKQYLQAIFFALVVNALTIEYHINRIIEIIEKLGK